MLFDHTIGGVDMKKIELTKEEFDRLMNRDKTLKEKEDKQRDQWRRRNARLMIMTKKAEDKGLKCSEVEIDEYLKTAPTKRKSKRS